MKPTKLNEKTMKGLRSAMRNPLSKRASNFMAHLVGHLSMQSLYALSCQDAQNNNGKPKDQEYTDIQVISYFIDIIDASNLKEEGQLKDYELDALSEYTEKHAISKQHAILFRGKVLQLTLTSPKNTTRFMCENSTCSMCALGERCNCRRLCMDQDFPTAYNSYNCYFKEL